MTVCFEEHTYILNHVHNVIKKKKKILIKKTGQSHFLTSDFIIQLLCYDLVGWSQTY